MGSFPQGLVPANQCALLVDANTALSKEEILRRLGTRPPLFPKVLVAKLEGCKQCKDTLVAVENLDDAWNRVILSFLDPGSLGESLFRLKQRGLPEIESLEEQLWKDLKGDKCHLANHFKDCSFKEVFEELARVRPADWAPGFLGGEEKNLVSGDKYFLFILAVILATLRQRAYHGELVKEQAVHLSRLLEHHADGLQRAAKHNIWNLQSTWARVALAVKFLSRLDLGTIFKSWENSDFGEAQELGADCFEMKSRL